MSPPLLLGLFYAALSVAWILGNPTGAAPDEPSHYLNALAVASGELKGEPVIAPLPASGDDAKNDARKQAWLERTTRGVDNFALAHPTTYLVSGALARVTDNPVDAIRLGRLGDAAVSIGLVWWRSRSSGSDPPGPDRLLGCWQRRRRC